MHYNNSIEFIAICCNTTLDLLLLTEADRRTAFACCLVLLGGKFYPGNFYAGWEFLSWVVSDEFYHFKCESSLTRKHLVVFNCLNLSVNQTVFNWYLTNQI